MQTDNQVDIIMNSIEVLKTGPQILMANQIRKDKAIQVGENILASIQENGMSQTTDDRCMAYLSNLNAAHTTMKEDRAGITQIMSNLSKMYTQVENEIDIKKEGTVPAKVQAARDAWAKSLAIEKEAKRKAAELIAEKAKEEIEICSAIGIRFSNHYNDFLSAAKQSFQNSFNTITIENFGEKAHNLKSITPTLNIEKLKDSFKYAFPAISIHRPEEIIQFITDTCADKINDYTNNYAAEISGLLDDMIEKLPSKLTELTAQKKLDDELQREQDIQRKANIERAAAMATANKAEKERLEKEAADAKITDDAKLAAFRKEVAEAAEIQEQRELAEAAKIAADNLENKRLADLEAEVKKQGEQTMVMFEQEAATAVISTPAAKQGVEITVLHPVGYTQIFALWFEGEGKNLPIDKLGNTKLDQMKGWCEKKAMKDNTRIESKFLQYQDSFKAINKKAK